MAELILLDSFDHYNSATSLIKNVSAITVTTGRTGNCGYAGWNSPIQKQFEKRTTLCAGVAYRSNSLNGALLQFSNPLGVIAGLHQVGDGRLRVSYHATYDSPADPPLLTIGNWYYIEFNVTVTYDAGPPITSTLSYEIKVNEESIKSNSITIGYSDFTEYGFTTLTMNPPGGYTGAAWFDDLYLTAGEFLGDLRIYVIRPDGDDTPSQWTPSPAGDHFEQVNDTNPDGDTTTLSSDTDGQQDMVTLEDISLTGEIKGIQGNTIAKKDDSGGSVIRTEYEISATPYEVADDKYLNYLSWVDHRDPMRLNPVTGLAFTVDEINAMKMGVKRIS